MFLLDTNVVSELRHTRPHPYVLRWIDSVSLENLYLSPMTVGEIQAGIEITRDQDTAKAEELETWLNGLLDTFSVIPVDSDAFRVWAILMHRQSNTLLKDALIAATAIVNSLIVVSRNVRDFQQLGVPVLNPFDSPP